MPDPVEPQPAQTNYEYLTHNNHQVVVDSAIRDGEGYKIATTYPRKVDIRTFPMGKTKMRILHGLKNAPSSVSLYVINKVNGEDASYDKIEADITVTKEYIDISFTELPPGGNDLELLVRSLI